MIQVTDRQRWIKGADRESKTGIEGETHRQRIKRTRHTETVTVVQTETGYTVWSRQTQQELEPILEDCNGCVWIMFIGMFGSWQTPSPTLPPPPLHHSAKYLRSRRMESCNCLSFNSVWKLPYACSLRTNNKLAIFSMLPPFFFSKFLLLFYFHFSFFTFSVPRIVPFVPFPPTNLAFAYFIFLPGLSTFPSLFLLLFSEHLFFTFLLFFLPSLSPPLSLPLFSLTHSRPILKGTVSPDIGFNLISINLHPYFLWSHLRLMKFIWNFLMFVAL